MRVYRIQEQEGLFLSLFYPKRLTSKRTPQLISSPPSLSPALVVLPDPEAAPKATLLETKKSFSRRAVDQLGFIRESNSLVALSGKETPRAHPPPSSPPSDLTSLRLFFSSFSSDQTISFYDSSTLTLLTTLTQTRGAQTFAIHTSVSLDSSSSNDPSSSSSLSTSPPPSDSVPTITTTLLVGLKKRLLLFRWSDGSSVPSPDPLLLPHTPRSMAFVTPNRVVAAYTSSEQVVIALDPMRVLGEVAKAESLPEGGAAGAGGAGGGGGGESRPMSVASGLGGLGLGGMGGYMGLGTGKGKASVVRVAEGEVLVGRDSEFLDRSRSEGCKELTTRRLSFARRRSPRRVQR